MARFADTFPTNPVFEERGRILRPLICPPATNLLDQEAATHQSACEGASIRQYQGIGRGNNAAVGNADHREADRNTVIQTGPDHRQRLAVLARSERCRAGRGRFEVLSGIAIVVLDPPARGLHVRAVDVQVGRTLLEPRVVAR